MKVILFKSRLESDELENCSLKTKQTKTSTLIQVTICNKTSCFNNATTFLMSYSNTLLESLILAQDERWRRA